MKLRLGQGLGYGLLGMPLAFVSLPLYVQLPAHYAGQLGMPLGRLGALLLAVRALDALTDPLIGAGVDRLLLQPRRHRLIVVATGALLLTAGFHALFFPPVREPGALLAWAAGALVLCYLAYSTLSVLHQAWGAQLGSSPALRAQVVAWREGSALAGVLVASVLPAWLGLQATGAALAAALVIALVALTRAPAPRRSPTAAPADVFEPWAWPAFRRLMAVYLLNGVASALPATLVLFYIRDRLQWPAGEPLLLGCYFAAAALSLPAWVRLAARAGLAATWATGILLSIAGFAGAAFLGAGDGPWFVLVCLASGAALGADLCVPPALLAGLVRGRQRAAEGVAFGWWNAASKLNLALAAGMALPLLEALGYRPGGAGSSAALPWVYAGLPCVLKALAGLALWQLWIRKTGSNP